MSIKGYLKKLTWKDAFFGVFTLISIVVPIIFVELVSKYEQINFDILKNFVLIGLYLVAPILSISIAIYYFTMSFKNYSSIYKKILNIVGAYIIIILSFSSIYYMQICIGDRDDAISKYIYYGMYSNPLLKDNEVVNEEKNKLISNNYKMESERAFKGINYRLWSGVDYIDLGHRQEEVKFTDQIIANSDIPMNDLNRIIKFVPNRINVYSECLYFSTIAMTTVGFGDISPNLWYSKLTVAVQMFLGQALILFTVGFFFYNLGNQKTKTEQDEQNIEYYL